MRHCWTVFQSDCAILHPFPQQSLYLGFLYPLQHLVVSPNRCITYRYMVLIIILLRVSDAWWCWSSSKSLLVIWLPLQWTVFYLFLISIVFLLLSFQDLLCILVLLDMWFTNILCWFVACIFFLMASSRAKSFIVWCCQVFLLFSSVNFPIWCLV